MLTKFRMMLIKCKQIRLSHVFQLVNSPIFQDRLVYIITGLILIYFAIMDILTYFHMQSIPIQRTPPEPVYAGFDYFAMLSIKGMMEDQLSCHILWPACEYFEQITNFSSIFSFIKPNMISIFGAIISVPAAILLSKKSLKYKRLAVLIFVFRLGLDGLDGVVFRMQNLNKAHQHTQLSIRHSLGWSVDAVCDVFAGACFLYGVYRTINQRSYKNRGGRTYMLLPRTISRMDGASQSVISVSESGDAQMRRSDFYISVHMLFLVFITGTSSLCWDKFADQYRVLFTTTFQTSHQQELQNQMFKSTRTFVIFWCWRLISGVSIINTAYFAIVYGYINTCIIYLVYFGGPFLFVLACSSACHIAQIYELLGVEDGSLHSLL